MTSAAMARELAHDEKKQEKWGLYNLQALAFAKEGKFARAQQLFRAAYDAAMRENLAEKADGILIDEANAEIEGGMTAAARATLHRVRPQTLSSPQTALLEAELGDTAVAERTLSANSASLGSDTLMTYVYEPQTRAAIALNQKKPRQAMEALQEAADYDFAAGFAIITARAEAYTMAVEPEKAAAEYKKILDHAGVDPVSALFPLAWLGLARAESQMGHTEQSRVDYEKLFSLWSQADADLPAFVAARREYKAIVAPHPAALKQ